MITRGDVKWKGICNYKVVQCSKDVMWRRKWSIEQELGSIEWGSQLDAAVTMATCTLASHRNPAGSHRDLYLPEEKHQSTHVNLGIEGR